eukprot:scaffold4648_cov74-Cylindrotheca_fusiformis.AAC.4
MPNPSAISSVLRHVKRYEQNLNEYYQGLFGGWLSPAAIPTAFDRTNFCIGDQLPFKSVKIYVPQKQSSIPSGETKSIDLLLMPIGVSRTMSMSMAIDPIRKLMAMHAISNLQKAEHDNFSFHKHPYKDWIRQTKLEFGGKWQGGPYHRYSPHGVRDIDSLLGNEVGEQRLTAITKVLATFVRWVDDLSGKLHPPSSRYFELVDGLVPVEDIDCETTKCIEGIRNIFPSSGSQEEEDSNRKGIDFGYFRLAIFLTVANGCGITLPGRHLRQLFVPAEGTGAFNHLKNPSQDQMSTEQAARLASSGNSGGQIGDTAAANDGASTTLDRDRFDEAMREISAGIGYREYFRDEIECIPLCESLPGRQQKEKKDWYCRDLTLYDLDSDGRLMSKKYGLGNKWKFVNQEY